MKLQYKIAFLLLSFAWLPYAFLAAWGMHLQPVARIIISIVGFFTWFLGAISLTVLSGSSIYWNSIKDLEKKIVKADEAYDMYKKAEEKLITAAFKLKNEKC